MFIDPDPSTTNTVGTGTTASEDLPTEDLPPGEPPSPHPVDTSASNATTVYSDQYRFLISDPTARA
jgi:hypothetical protein